MNSISLKLILILVSIFLVNSSVFSQSPKKMTKYHTHNWVSAAKITDVDTVAMEYTDETLNLQKDGVLDMTGQGSEMSGKWSYDRDTNQLVMELTTMDGKDVTSMNMKVGLDILQAKDKILTLSKEGSRTLIYVLEGSGITFGD